MILNPVPFLASKPIQKEAESEMDSCNRAENRDCDDKRGDSAEQSDDQSDSTPRILRRLLRTPRSWGGAGLQRRRGCFWQDPAPYYPNSFWAPWAEKITPSSMRTMPTVQSACIPVKLSIIKQSRRHGIHEISLLGSALAVRPVDSQLLHFVDERRSRESQFGCCTFGTADDPSHLFECL